jgi:hypothetical protein
MMTFLRGKEERMARPIGRSKAIVPPAWGKGKFFDSRLCRSPFRPVMEAAR